MISELKKNQSLDPTLERLLALIPEGEENARPSKELALLLKVSERSITSLVNKLRNERLVGSKKYGSGGYYIPIDEDEAREFVASLEREQKTLTATLKAQKKALTKEYQSALE